MYKVLKPWKIKTEEENGYPDNFWTPEDVEDIMRSRNAASTASDTTPEIGSSSLLNNTIV